MWCSAMVLAAGAKIPGNMALRYLVSALLLDGHWRSMGARGIRRRSNLHFPPGADHTDHFVTPRYRFFEQTAFRRPCRRIIPGLVR